MREPNFLFFFPFFFPTFNSFFFFYCYSITVVCLFSPSLHPTPGEPTSLPHLHPPPGTQFSKLRNLMVFRKVSVTYIIFYSLDTNIWSVSSHSLRKLNNKSWVSFKILLGDITKEKSSEWFTFLKLSPIQRYILGQSPLLPVEVRLLVTESGLTSSANCQLAT